MIRQMLGASVAVLRHPAVATFEEHERDAPGAAALYVALGAVINGLLGALAYVVQRPYVAQQIQELQRSEQNIPSRFWDVLRGQSVGGALVWSLLPTLVSFAVYLGLVYLLGRRFGGTGRFGELAYDTALFSVPLSVLAALVQVVAFGPLAAINWFIWLGLGGYQIYLTYLSIQAGLNVPLDKAILVMVLLVVLGVLAACLLGVLVVILFMYVGLV